MFDKMKQLYDMQKKARELQRQLESIKVEKATPDNTVRIKVNGTQKVESVIIDSSWLSPDKKSKLENTLCQLINDSFAEVQRTTAAQAADLMKDLKGLNIPGLE